MVPSHVGDASMPGYNADLFDAGVQSAGNGRNSWVGQSDDPFFLDLRVFDLLYGGDFSEAGDDTLDGFNVNTMVLQVPKAQLRGPDDGVIGIWTTASRALDPHPGRATARSSGEARSCRSRVSACRS